MKSERTSILDWPTVQDIPSIIHLKDTTVLKGDFNVQSSLNSARIFYIKFLYYLTLQGQYLSQILQLVIVYLYLVAPILTLFFIVRFLEVYFDKSIDPAYLAFSGLLVVFIFPILQYSMPFGWRSVYSMYGVFPMKLSFLIGIILNISTVKYRDIGYLAMTFFAINILVHPVIGLIHILFSALILWILGNLNFRLILRVLAISLVPILFLKFFFGGSSLSEESFVNGYVFIRHPHHYVVSRFMRWESFLQLLPIVLSFILSIKWKCKKLFNLNLSIILLLSFSIALQWFGTEVIKSKSIAILGPIRLTSYLSMFSGFSTIGLFLAKNKQVQTVGTLQKPIMISWIVPVLIGLTVWSLAYVKPESEQFYIKHKPLFDWIKKSTSKEDVFYVNGFNAHSLRIFAGRTPYADKAYPFNLNDHETFMERYVEMKKIEKSDRPDRICSLKNKGIKYFITNEIFEEQEAPLVSLNKIHIYSLEFMLKKLKCYGNQI